ncbi:tetratricopeptide repeat protein [Desulfovibrio sp. OttesenSCG-928-I05]|nr:tetratricopeptide repeat protein [Desulfovibrio sp. OttesenSCG-928-I05]
MGMIRLTAPATFRPRARSLAIILFLLLTVLLVSCGPRAEKAYNPMGLSGKINPEAETAFARAHVLWRDSEVCSDPALAVELLDKAIALEPEYAQAYMRRGLAKSTQRDWEGAFDDLTRALRLDPSAENYAYRGLISMRGGNALGARKDLDRSIALDSDQHKAWNFRAALDLLEGKNEAACSDFKEGCSNGDCVGLESARNAGICP